MDWVNNVVLLLIALINLYSVYLVSRQGKVMKLLEVNTNSIKDALVEKTDEAAQLRGEKQGRLNERQDIIDREQMI